MYCYILPLKLFLCLSSMKFSRNIKKEQLTVLFYFKMVETSGIEPLTPCLQGRCSPS